MDRNTVTGLILIFAIFIGFSMFNNYKQKKSYESTMHIADSLYDARAYEDALVEYQKALKYKQATPEAIEKINTINSIHKPVSVPDNSDTLISETIVDTEIVLPAKQQNQFEIQTSNIERLGEFSGSGSGELDFITLENDKLILKISNRGGRIYSAELKDFYTHDGKPLILFDGDSTVFGFKFFTSDNRPIETNNLYFTPYSTNPVIDASSRQGVVRMRLETSSGGYIEYVYTLDPGSYMVDFDVKFVGLSNVIAGNINSLTLDWKAYIRQQEKSRHNENQYTNLKYRYYQDVIDGFRDRSQKDFEEADITTKLEWVAFKNQFFSTIVLTEEFFNNGFVTSTKMPEDSKYLRYFTAELGLPYKPEGTTEYDLKILMVPNNFKMLKDDYGHELHELVMLGKSVIKWINQYVILTLFNWLNKSIANYGIIILILTLIIKLALFPLTFKSFQSQAKMKVLKPMVDEINKKFPKKEDAMKKQQATMALYKKAGVSPLGGCLPMVLQMPILFAMFRFFPTSIELRQESFLWAQDLSTYDSILNLPFTIPMYGDHVSLFTLLMTISTILTMRLNSPAATGQEQVPGMKMMMNMMPIMFMLILNSFPSGLTYYYFLANIITFGQNMISKKFINAEGVLKTLEANKKKTPKKSKFQKRLEEAAKQKGYRPKKG